MISTALKFNRRFQIDLLTTSALGKILISTKQDHATPLNLQSFKATALKFNRHFLLNLYTKFTLYLHPYILNLKLQPLYIGCYNSEVFSTIYTRLHNKFRTLCRHRKFQKNSIWLISNWFFSFFFVELTLTSWRAEPPELRGLWLLLELVAFCLRTWARVNIILASVCASTTRQILYTNRVPLSLLMWPMRARRCKWNVQWEHVADDGSIS